MADRTGIEWTDATWNPVTGCTEVSAGCDNCYARTFAERWRGTPGHHFENGFDVQLRPDRLDLPLRWRKPRRVFVNSMSDLFHADVPDTFIGSVFDTMALADQHTFQILTKRPARARALLRRWQEKAADRAHAGASFRRHDMLWCEPRVWPLPNVWLGVSIEDQKRADLRIPALLDTPAAVRWLSCEPLLGDVDLAPWLDCDHASMTGTSASDVWECDHCQARIREVVDLNGPVFRLDSRGEHRLRYDLVADGRRIDWVIAGGESGPKARPMNPEWVRSLRDQCQTTGTPFLFKQWGAWAPTGQVRHSPLARWERLIGDTVVCRIGKRAAGRVLDGQTWDQYPSRTDDVEVIPS